MSKRAIRQIVTAAGFKVVKIEQRGVLYKCFVESLPVTTQTALEKRFKRGQFRGHGIGADGSVDRIYILLTGGDE